MDDLGPALLGLHHPLVAHGVALGPVGRGHDHVGVDDVDQVRGHRSAPEARAERRHRRRVAKPRRVLHIHQAHASRELGDQVVLLVVQHRGAEPSHALAPVDRHRLVRDLHRLDEALVAGLFHALGDLGHHPVERLLLPPVTAGRPVETLGEALVVDRELVGRRPLGAERALRVRRVGIALDVDDLAVLDVDELGAAHRAVGTNTGEDLGLLDPQRGGRSLDGRQVDAVHAKRDTRGGGPGKPDEVAS